MGLDVTTRCQVDDQLVDLLANCGKPGTKLLSQLPLCYRENRPPHLPPPMVVRGQDLLEFSGEDIQVELRGEHTRGMTLNRFQITASGMNIKTYAVRSRYRRKNLRKPLPRSSHHNKKCTNQKAPTCAEKYAKRRNTREVFF